METALARFGMKTGIAYQMADDILDYMAIEQDLGKRLGKDLREGKITLPLIYLLSSATDTEVEEIKGVIEKGLKKRGLKRILNLFEKYHTIDRSLQKAQNLIGEAKAELSIFPDVPAKKALYAIADYTLVREK
jgi:octaprenyl-diphosphate synthase